MSKVDVLAVMENAAQSLPMYSNVDGLRYSKADMLKATSAVYGLIEALYVALPYVTDAEGFPEQFKPGVVSRHVKQIREAIEAVTP